MKNIFIASNKGGVGKTMVAVNLACYLAKNGYKTGLLDIDIHGPNVPKMIGIENGKFAVEDNKLIPFQKNGVYVVSPAFLLESEDSPIVWRGPLKTKLINELLEKVKWPLDLKFRVIDLPPGTGDETITIMQKLKENSGAIVVSTPSSVSVIDVKKAIKAIQQMNIPLIGLVENMSGEIFGSGIIKKLAEEEGINFLGEIKLDKTIAESSNNGNPFILNQDTNVSKEFKKTAEKILSYKF